MADGSLLITHYSSPIAHVSSLIVAKCRLRSAARTIPIAQSLSHNYNSTITRTIPARCSTSPPFHQPCRLPLAAWPFRPCFRPLPVPACSPESARSFYNFTLYQNTSSSQFRPSDPKLVLCCVQCAVVLSLSIPSPCPCPGPGPGPLQLRTRPDLRLVCSSRWPWSCSCSFSFSCSCSRSRSCSYMLGLSLDYRTHSRHHIVTARSVVAEMRPPANCFGPRQIQLPFLGLHLAWTASQRSLLLANSLSSRTTSGAFRSLAHPRLL
jgi:hypothetical protein